MRSIQRAWHYLRPYWLLAIGVAVSVIIAGLTELLVPWPLQVLIDYVLGNYPLPGWMTALLPALTAKGTLLIVTIAAGLLVALGHNGLVVLVNYLQTRLHQRMALDFRCDLFQHAQRLSLAFHDQKRSAAVVYAINNQGDAISGLLLVVPALGQSLITLVGMFWILLVIDWTLALLALAVVPFMFYSVHYYATHIQQRLTKVMALEEDSLSIVQEAMSMLRVIVSFQREPHEYRRFRDQGAQAVDARVDVTVRQTLFSLAVNMITAIGTAAVLGLGAYRVLQVQLTVGELLVIMAYIAAVYKPLETIIYTLGTVQDKIVAQRAAFELLDIQPEVRESPTAIEMPRCRGEIVFDGVDFHYSGRPETIKGISFRATPGQRVAIVGPTGAGKTTLISLLPRFYDPAAGRILLDGADIRDFKLSALRSQMSLVLQEPLLFSGTIAQNIRYGKLDASEEEVVEAARAANAHDFIQRLPKQYETELGERGAKLSGGERQRLCIARAFLKNAPILILDEPTSAIDSKTEAVILEALDRLMIGRTSFMIAHRLSTIHDADLMLVLDRGRLLQVGTHSELLLQDGLYRQLHEMQTRNFRPKAQPVA